MKMNKREFRPLAELGVRDGDEVLESDGRKYRVVDVEPEGLTLAFLVPDRAKEDVREGRFFTIVRRSVDVSECAEKFTDPTESGCALAILDFNAKRKAALRTALDTCVDHGAWDAARAIVDKLEELK